ncbi:MAG TPA: 1-acyl-sn-glycerol-3-phosphate acyltransferase [Vicinamibacteria bacterium]|nr:1-acyl-sn-glycerol-3-phosphate acyltransferase [Vicinamibacteria bacterium]
MPGAFLYRMLRPMARPLALLFHRSLQVEHPERLPPTGPVLLAANHPNMLLDVLLLGASTRRTLHFLGKATLFGNPLLGGLLRLCGVLPVHRRKESPGRMQENAETFAACHRLLGAGGAIAIFPEGVSHDREAVLPLKTGCARIVLEAEAKAGFTLSAVIVPVGITFSNRELFRSDALVSFGEPLDPSPQFAAYRDGSPAEAVKGLTLELESALRSLAAHVPREEDEELLRSLRGFFAGTSAPTADRLLIDRTLLDAVDDFRDRHPIEYRRLRRRVLAHGRVLDLLGLTHDEIDRSYRLWPVLRYLVPRVALAVLGLPFFLAGALVHYLPYKIPALLARLLAKDRVAQATLKLLLGLVTFPLFYALAVLATGRLVTLALLPPLGLVALLYSEQVAELLREIRIFLWHHGPGERRQRLKQWREELVLELEARRREYETLAKPLSG